MKWSQVRKLILSMVMAGPMLSYSALAEIEKMDQDTTTIVINKLEGVLKNGSNTQGTDQGAIYLRLGDLYAERARLAFMSEVEKNCQECLGSKKDRIKALHYYELALPTANSDIRGGLLIQMAHLNKVLGNLNKAEGYFLTLLKEGVKRHGARIIGQGTTSYGDFFFDKGEFEKALRNYEIALKNKATPQPGYVHYRKAWCLLNTGRVELAKQEMIKILTSSKLMDLDQNGEVDSSFQIDASKDLATFMGKGVITRKEYDLISDLSPKSRRIDHLVFLAEEAERLSMKASALTVWHELFKEKELDNKTRIDGQIHVIQLELDLERKDQAVAAAKVATKSIQRWSCQGDDCAQIQNRYKRVLADWNKLEKKKPSVQLLHAYNEYLKAFDTDLEVFYWAAQLAKQLNEQQLAFDLNYKASVLAAKALGKKDAPKTAKTVFEGSLLGHIEAAEALAKPQLKISAYDHYLKLNGEGAKAPEVRYQKARSLYELKKINEAQDLFTVVALKEKTLDRSLRLQAADLSLDCLVLMKNEVELEKTAVRFAEEFSERRSEYQKMARTSLLNQSEQSIKKADKSEYKQMLARLKAVQTSDAPLNDKITAIKNRIILAERLQDLSEVQKAAGELKGLSGVSEKDSQFAMSKMAWAAEMSLDFKKAYKINEDLASLKSNPEGRELKLAVLAELAGMNADGHYRNFMKMTKDSRKATEVQADLITRSGNPWGNLEKEYKKLMGSPEVLADTALQIYAAKGFHPLAETLVGYPKFKNTASGQFIGKLLFLRKFISFENRMLEHKISLKSDGLAQRGLSERLKLIAQTEEWANKAIQSGDWSLQIITLSRVNTENQKLSQIVLKMPVPRGLSKEQMAQYQDLIKQKAKEISDKAKTVDQKLAELWRNDKVFQALADQYRGARPEVQNAFKYEIERLNEVAPSNQKWKLARLLEHRSNVPKASEIADAKQDLREDPFSLRRAEKLKDLGDKAGQKAMVSYLVARMNQLKEAYK